MQLNKKEGEYMYDMPSIIKYSVSILGTSLTWLFGSWDTSLTVLLIFMLIDYITGLLKGYTTKELNSSVGLKGIFKKSGILFILIIAVLLDRMINADTWIFRTLVSYFYVANEGLSIIENCSVIGVPIPSQITDALSKLKKDNE